MGRPRVLIKHIFALEVVPAGHRGQGHAGEIPVQFGGNAARPVVMAADRVLVDGVRVAVGIVEGIAAHEGVPRQAANSRGFKIPPRILGADLIGNAVAIRVLSGRNQRKRPDIGVIASGVNAHQQLRIVAEAEQKGAARLELIDFAAVILARIHVGKGAVGLAEHLDGKAAGGRIG